MTGTPTVLKGPSLKTEYEGSTKLSLPLLLSFRPKARHTTLNPKPEPITKTCLGRSALTIP
jgi:hypothetical protein